MALGIEANGDMLAADLSHLASVLILIAKMRSSSVRGSHPLRQTDSLAGRLTDFLLVYRAPPASRSSHNSCTWSSTYRDT